MNLLFYCDTPFQVLNILNMHLHRVLGEDPAMDTSTILIVNQFSSANSIAERIKNEELFDEIILLEKEKRKDQKNGYLKIAGIAGDTLFPKKLLKQQTQGIFRFKKNQYDVIVASFFTHTVGALRTLNPTAKFFMVDDGAGSYFGDIIKGSRSEGYLKLLKLVNKGNQVEKPLALYVNCVEACGSELTDRILPLPELTEEFLRLAFRVFNIKEKLPEYRQPIIWLSQASKAPYFNKTLEQMNHILMKYKDDIIVRLHPREADKPIYQPYATDKEGNMWELQLSRISLEDKLLVSIQSTAMLTPKLLFGQEPWLLFGYKLIRPAHDSGDVFSKIVSHLRMAYTNKERIWVPDTWEEFEECILSFLRKSEPGKHL